MGAASSRASPVIAGRRAAPFAAPAACRGVNAIETRVCRRFVVSGRVQGVFFRASTQKEAEALGLTGHAINLDSGDVEVLACGDLDAVERLEEWLQAGPPLASVTGLHAEDRAFKPMPGFRTA